MKNFRLLVLLLAIVSLKACDSGSSTFDTAQVKEELENRKIRRVSEVHILEKAFSKGKKVIDTISAVSNSIVPDEPDTTLNQNFRLGALQPLVDFLQQENKAEIKKIFIEDLNGTTVRDPEKQILEAYQYNIAHGLKVEDNVQLLDHHIFYSAPVIENGVFKGMWSIYFDKKELIKSTN